MTSASSMHEAGHPKPEGQGGEGGGGGSGCGVTCISEANPC